jgi:hypothetical protein
LQQLDEATPAKPPAKKAPRKAVQTATPAKAPAKRAAAKKAAATSPAKKAAAKAPAKRAPAKKSARAARDTPWPVSDTPVPTPPAAARQPARPRPELSAAVPVAAAPAPAAAPPRQRDGVVKFLVVVTVLLLAAAAGLAAAAYVEHRDRTYRADTVVRLDSGAQPTLPVEETLSAGVTKYIALGSAHDFTLTAAQRAELSTSALQGDIAGKQRAPRQIELDVFADTAQHATALAAAAGDALVEAVNLQEAVDQTSAGDRLGAAVVVPSERVTKTAPKDSTAWIAGALAAGGVLVLGGLGAALRATRRS